MPKYTGKDMVIKFGTVDVSGAGRTLDISQTADEIDVTAYGSTDKEFIVGKVERSATMEVLDNSTDTLIRTSLAPGTSNSMAWFPIGTASGNPKFTVGTAVVLENSISYPYDDAVTMSVNVRLSGAVTEATAP